MAVNLESSVYTWESCQGDLSLLRSNGKYRLQYETKDRVVTPILPKNVSGISFKSLPEKVEEFCQNYFFKVKRVNDEYQVIFFEADIRDGFEEDGESEPKSFMGNIGFEFNKLERQEHIEFSKEAPRYRIVSRGLNFEGKCATKACEAFEKLVIIPKGLGMFRIAEELDDSDCPACGENIPFKNIRRLGFWNCDFTIQGKQIMPEEKSVDKKGCAERKHYTTYQPGDDCQWIYLNVTTEAQKSAGSCWPMS